MIQAFYNYYSLLWEVKNNGQSLDNLTNVQESALQSMASTHSSIAYNAQAWLELVTGIQESTLLPNYNNGGSSKNSAVDFEEKAFYVSPNPISDIGSIHYKLEKREKAILSLYDINGNKIKSSVIKSRGSYSLDATHFKTGLYFYTIANEKGILHREKFIIAR